MKVKTLQENIEQAQYAVLMLIGISLGSLGLAVFAFYKARSAGQKQDAISRLAEKLFQVYYFFYMKNLEPAQPRFSRDYIRSKFELSENDAKELLDFLERRFLIRNWLRREDPTKPGEQMTHPGHAAMDVAISNTINYLKNSPNDAIKHAIDIAESADLAKRPQILYDKGVEGGDFTKELLDTMYDMLQKYLNSLKYFEFFSITKILDIHNRDDTLMISAKIHPIYIKDVGPLPCVIYKFQAYRDDSKYSEATMNPDGTIRNSIIFLQNSYPSGTHKITCFYQLTGYQQVPDRWKSYASISDTFVVKSTVNPST